MFLMLLACFSTKPLMRVMVVKRTYIVLFSLLSLVLPLLTFLGFSRRTGQSGPLGELFDHCVDAVNTSLGVLIFCAAANTGYGWPVFAAQFGTLCNFYFSTWEEYHTGTLFLSFFSGPVEGIIIVCGLFLTTAYFGPGFWNTPVLELLGVTDVPAFVESYRELTVLNIYLIISTVCLVFNILTAAGNVIAANHKNKIRARPAFTGVIPFLLFYVSLVIWASSSRYILHTYLLLPFTLTVGFSVALSVGRIITAHVTSQKFPITNPLMVYPTLAVIIQAVGVKCWDWDPLTTVTALVWIGFGLTMGVYSFFVAELIIEITTYLDIYCLRIKHHKTQ